MSDDKSTALAPAPAALPAKPEKPTRSLVADLAEQAGIDPGNFLAAVKTAAGCKGATNEHFMVLLMQAQKYGLDPLSSPPQLQLLDVGQGPQVYARLDAYKSFLLRAEEAGKVEWRRYREDWLPDVRMAPKAGTDRVLRRAGVLTLKLRGNPEPVEKVVWFDEWSGRGQWQTRGSHMLESRAIKEAVRDYLGLLVYDTDDAEKIGDSPKRIDAEVSDSPGRPAVPIPTLRRPSAPPPPLELDETPQGKPEVGLDTASAPEGRASRPPANDDGSGSGAPAVNSASPAAPEIMSKEESLALDREIADDQAKREGLFE